MLIHEPIQLLCHSFLERWPELVTFVNSMGQLLTDLKKRIQKGFPSLSSTSTWPPCPQVTSEMSQALPTFPLLPASRATFSPKKTLPKHKKLVKCRRRPKPNAHISKFSFALFVSLHSKYCISVSFSFSLQRYKHRVQLSRF